MPTQLYTSQCQGSPLSNFFNSPIIQPKLIRIKVPYLMIKTMQRRSSSCRVSDQSKKKEKLVNVGKKIPKKVGLIFSSVFRRWRSQEKCCCGERNYYKVHSELESEKEAQILKDRVGLDVQSKCCNSEKEIWDPEEVDDHDQKISNISNKPNRKVSSLFRKKRINSGSGKCRWENESNRFPSRKLITSQSLKRLKSIKKKMGQKYFEGKSEEENEGEREEEEGDKELCKKRILMGEKCKPLTSSGTLHYDKDGILLPEVLYD